ncbi:MAG: PAS-domain containing protein [Sneathiellales bacterium]|nr:PAS-domain containing protein [Sneathiellales bacterium]
MTVPAVPEYEEQRLEVLRALDILDTDVEEGFDRLTRLVKSYFDMPVVLVSLVDKDRLWFKSSQGVSKREIPREGTFCSHAILGDDIFYVPNALNDERFRNSAVVVNDPCLRFYAGVPLSAEGGLKVGTLCVADTKPREFNSDQFAALKDFGDCVEQQLVQARLQNDARFLVSQTSRLNTLLEAIPDGIVTIDDKDCIESLNTEAAHIFGYEAYEILGTNFETLMPDLGGGGWSGFISRYLETPEEERPNLSKECTGIRKDKTAFPIDISVREMFLDGQRLFTGVVRDITERKAFQDELRLGREILEATKENIPVGISVFDENLRLAVLNDQAGYLLNFPEKLQEIGTTYEECTRYVAERGDYGEGDPDVIVRKHMRFAKNPSSRMFVSNFGSDKQVEVSTRPMPGGGFVSIYTDITERLRNKEKLEQLVQEANSANQAKSDFLSTMSHEIRTPLNGVIGVAHMLGDTSLDEDQRRKLNAILRSGNTLLDLINDVLDMSKIEAGNLDIEEIECDLRDIVKTIKIPFEIQAKDKGLTFETDIDPALAECVISDPTRLRQITMNLLSNAFKFTEKGGISLSVKALSDGKNGKQDIRLSVQDSGVGIPKDRQAAIFEAFSQADSSVARKFGGTGLGLSIIKSLAHLMEGEIVLTSEEGKGSRFDVEFTFDIGDKSKLKNAYGQGDYSADSEARKLRILVAEDNDVNVMIVEALLKKMGHDFVVANSGLQALNIFNEKSFDLILMDIHMPEMDGMEATKAIREKGHDIPIIGLTAEAFKERHEHFMKIGMNDVLTKPFTENQLKDALIKQSCNLPNEQHSDVEEVSVDMTDLETQIRDDLLAGTFSDPIGSDAKFQEFQEQLGCDVAAMLLQKTPGSVMKELESLREGFQNQDSALILRAAHTIAGVSSSMCAERLANQASLIEQNSETWDDISGSLPAFEKTVEETLAWWADKVEAS